MHGIFNFCQYTTVIRSFGGLQFCSIYSARSKTDWCRSRSRYFFHLTPPNPEDKGDRSDMGPRQVIAFCLILFIVHEQRTFCASGVASGLDSSDDLDNENRDFLERWLRDAHASEDVTYPDWVFEESTPNFESAPLRPSIDTDVEYQSANDDQTFSSPLLTANSFRTTFEEQPFFTTMSPSLFQSGISQFGRPTQYNPFEASFINHIPDPPREPSKSEEVESIPDPIEVKRPGRRGRAVPHISITPSAPSTPIVEAGPSQVRSSSSRRPARRRDRRSTSRESKIYTTEELRKRPYVCESCGATFPRLEHYRRHYRSLHMEERPFQCPECGKTFKRKGASHFTLV